MKFSPHTILAKYYFKFRDRTYFCLVDLFRWHLCCQIFFLRKVLKLLNSIFFYRDLSPAQLSSLLKSWERLTAEFSEVIILTKIYQVLTIALDLHILYVIFNSFVLKRTYFVFLLVSLSFP